MKSPYRILFATAAVVLLLLVVVTRQARTTPEEFFEDVEARIAAGRYDREQTLLNLDQVLARADAEGSAELRRRVLVRRGRLLMELGAYDRARNDLTVAHDLGDDDATIESDLIELEARAGDYRAAEERVLKLAQRTPDSPDPLVRRGSLRQAAGERVLNQALDVVARELIATDAQKVQDLAWRSAALDPDDARRVGIAHALRKELSGLEPQRTEELTRAADLASEDLSVARDAYARSLALGLRTEALSSLVELYRRAGRAAEAVDLITATIGNPLVRDDPVLAEQMMGAMLDLGRVRYAAEIATLWSGRDAMNSTAEFREFLCAVLYRGERWLPLQRAQLALRAIGNAQQQDAANFYGGSSFVELAQWDPGEALLRSFLVRVDTPEPVPGARAAAYRRCARASRELGRLRPEREALEGAVAREPDHDGELWLRLAELQLAASEAGYRVPEERYAKGMSLLPARTAELMPRWEEIGAKELDAQGLDLDAERANIAKDLPRRVPATASHFELYSMAKLFAEANDLARAQALLRQLLLRLPTFLPALDLSLDIALRQGRARDAFEFGVARMSVAGRDERFARVLLETPFDERPSRDQRALIQADPLHSGRLAVALRLSERDQGAAALASLESLGANELGVDGRLLVARLQLERGRAADAFATAKAIGTELFTLAGGVEVFAQAAIQCGETAALEAMCKAWSRSPSFTRPRAVALVDQLLWLAAEGSARTLLERLDESPKTRGTDVLLRLGACAALRGDQGTFAAVLERAQAFETRGQADLLELVWRAHHARFESLPAIASRVLAAQPPAKAAQPPANEGRDASRDDALRIVLLRLIQEREGAQDSLRTALLDPARARDPQWVLAAAALSDDTLERVLLQADGWFGAHAAEEARAFLRGAQQTTDPRAGLATLLALTDPIATSAVVGRLANDNLWAQWLRASRTARLGDVRRARGELNALRARYADFGPAWELEESLAFTAAQKGGTQHAAFRVQRLAALGDAAGDASARAIDRSRAAEQRNDLGEALSIVQQALALDPTHAGLAWRLGQVQLRRNQPEAAWIALRRAAGLEGEAPTSGDPGTALTADLIDAYRALQGSPARIDHAAARTFLAAFAAARPRDPRVALEQARNDLALDPMNPSLGAARAYARLDTFLSGARTEALDDLAPGSLDGWTQFLLGIDPERARVHVERELDLAPAELAAWIALAQIDEQRGDLASARKRLELVRAFAPGARISRELLRVIGAGDAQVEELDQLVTTITNEEGVARPDAPLRLTLARALLNLGPRLQQRVCDLLDGMSPAELPTREARVEHALVSATAHLSRGRSEDLERAREVLDAIEPSLRQRFERTHALALRGLVAQATPVTPPTARVEEPR